jgi:hypothetical protein
MPRLSPGRGPSTRPGPWLSSAALALAGYAGAVALAAWPLPLRLASALPGDPSGDTGVYVWNHWIFRHEIAVHGAVPIRTSHVLVASGPVDLSLHNFTWFQNALAYPLIPLVGVVAAFNLVWLAMQALAGFAVFLLAQRVTGRPATAWLGGLLFACSPSIVSRTMAHQSLVAAAPIAIFLLLVERTMESRRATDALLAGLAAAWAALCDAYYGIYCVLLGLVLAADRAVVVSARPAVRAVRPAAAVLTGVALAVASATVALAAGLGGTFEIGGVRVSARTPYTPGLLLTVVLAARAALAVRHRWHVRLVAPDRRAAGLVLAAAVPCALALSPLLVAAARRLLAGGALRPRIFWRSSPPGVDLLAYVVPNPNHPLAPASWREWLSPRPDFYYEHVASIPWVAIGALAAAVWLARARPPRRWLVAAAVFGLLALGPFVHVAHTNTYLVGPWALLRYMPVVGAARMPTRLVVPLLIAVAVLFAWAIEAIVRRWPERRRALLAAMSLLLVFELLPVPRRLASAEVPPVYDAIRADREEGTVLELPFGIRDGLREVGRIGTEVLFFQTSHEHPLLGGYLSRVPRAAFRRAVEDPVLDALVALSERGVRNLPVDAEEAARRAAPDFAREVRLRYVVVDLRRTSPRLHRFAREAFGLEPVAADRDRIVYRVGGRR